MSQGRLLHGTFMLIFRNIALIIIFIGGPYWVVVRNRRLSPKCEDFINNIDDNIIENIFLILENESIDTKARVTKATDMLKYLF